MTMKLELVACMFAAIVGSGLSLLTQGPCMHGGQFFGTSCFRVGAVGSVGYARTHARQTFLVSAANYCGYLQYGAVGRLVRDTHSILLQTVQPQLSGFNPVAPFVLFGGSSGKFNVTSNFYVLHKATGAVVPALPTIINETNTDLVCEFRAPIPCADGYIYANYDPDAQGMPTCVRAFAAPMTLQDAKTVCGDTDKTQPRLKHLLTLHGLDVGSYLQASLPPGFMSWTAARPASYLVTLQTVPLLYEWQDGYVFSGPIYNETAVVEALVESGGSTEDIQVVWSPTYGLQAVDGRSAGTAFGAVCQTDVPYRIIPTFDTPTLTNRGTLVAYVSAVDVTPRYICPVFFAPNGGHVVCRQLGYSTGRMVEIPGVDDYNRLGREFTLCRGISCAGTESSLEQCGVDTNDMCCASPRVVLVDCIVTF